MELSRLGLSPLRAPLYTTCSQITGDAHPAVTSDGLTTTWGRLSPTPLLCSPSLGLWPIQGRPASPYHCHRKHVAAAVELAELGDVSGACTGVKPDPTAVIPPACHAVLLAQHVCLGAGRRSASLEMRGSYPEAQPPQRQGPGPLLPSRVCMGGKWL